MLVQHFGMKPTTAMKQSMRVNESDVHRLQRKWRQEGSKLLAEAREAQRREQAARMRAAMEQIARLVQGAIRHVVGVAADPRMQIVLAQIGETQRRVAETMNKIAASPEVQDMMRQAQEMQRRFEAEMARPEIQAMIRQLDAVRADPRMQAVLKEAESMQRRLTEAAAHDPSLQLGFKPAR